MSHTTSIKAVKIQSVTALRAAVAELAQTGTRISLQEGGTPRAYFANQAGMGAADFVIRLDDSKYDIGLYKQQDGSYEARTDFFGNEINKVLGGTPTKPEYREQAQMGKLFQMYGIHAATETARRKGHTVRRITGKNGLIQLELTGAGL